MLQDSVRCHFYWHHQAKRFLAKPCVTKGFELRSSQIIELNGWSPSVPISSGFETISWLFFSGCYSDFSRISHEHQLIKVGLSNCIVLMEVFSKLLYPSSTSCWYCPDYFLFVCLSGTDIMARPFCHNSHRSTGFFLHEMDNNVSHSLLNINSGLRG